ncbi:MAG: undecaprenyl-diphosphate phosphatase [Candidatus Pacearchaeota archaeon]
MYELVSALIIAIVQGLTEWLPISSSGHLLIFHKILDYKFDLMFDVALHFGTLMAVFVYFGKDIIDILEDFLKLRIKSNNFKLGLLLIAASVPAVVIGYFFESFFELSFGNLGIVALGFAITSVILLIASVDFRRLTKNKEEIGFSGALFVGLAQALAIFPGISRSGATISSGLLMGLREKEAVKFSFLMAIPVIFGASIVEIGSNKLSPSLIWATIVAFIVGLITIHLMLKFIVTKRKNLRWFALYCLLVALGIAAYLIVF